MPAPSDDREDLGACLKAGDPHYRAYVGPPEDYDLIAAMTFNLLTTLGLRQHHSLLDFGCGSLRIGCIPSASITGRQHWNAQPQTPICDLKFSIGNIPGRRGRFLPHKSLIPTGSRKSLSLGTQHSKERSPKSIGSSIICERRENFCGPTQGRRRRRLPLLPHDGSSRSWTNER